MYIYIFALRPTSTTAASGRVANTNCLESAQILQCNAWHDASRVEAPAPPLRRLTIDHLQLSFGQLRMRGQQHARHTSHVTRHL